MFKSYTEPKASSAGSKVRFAICDKQIQQAMSAWRPGQEAETRVGPGEVNGITIHGAEPWSLIYISLSTWYIQKANQTYNAFFLYHVLSALAALLWSCVESEFV